MDERIEELRAARDALGAEYDWIDVDTVASIESIYDAEFIELLLGSSVHKRVIEVAARYQVERSLAAIAERRPDLYARKRDEIRRWDDADKLAAAVDMLHEIGSWA